VHTTFQYGGADGKRWRLREAMLWEDPPSYYDPPGGLLRYEPHVPEALLSPAGGMHAPNTARNHIRLVEHQLAQLGGALALARALGRKLLLPPIVCAMDKAWYALDRCGAFSGAPCWALPIRHCPLDHVLEPSMLHVERTVRMPVPTTSRAHASVLTTAALPSSTPQVREHSLLSNLRTPSEVLSSRASVALDTARASTELSRLRGGAYAPIKVLTISNLAQLLLATGKDLYELGVLNTTHAQQLEHEGLHSVTGSWCCKPAGDPGPNDHLFRLPLLPGAAAGMLQRGGATGAPEVLDTARAPLTARSSPSSVFHFLDSVVHATEGIS